jgi:photosystem II stability/assembly factor-like uncharacterized protein
LLFPQINICYKENCFVEIEIEGCNMKFIFLLLSFSLQIYSQRNWTVVNPNTTDNLVDICFADNNYGWIISSNGTLLRTSDGGENWNASIISYQNLNAIKFVNDNEGWIVGNNGLIIKSTDSGVTWFEQPGGQNYGLRNLYFQNNQVGFICGGDGNIWPGGIVLKTSNGGNSWIQVSSSFTSSGLNTIFFINSSTGWTTGNGGDFYKSSDGGTSWDSIAYFTSEFESWHTATIFWDTLNGVTCGNYHATGNWGGEIFKTTDGGYTWNGIMYTGLLYAIAREPLINSLYIVGENYWNADGLIYNSTDGGDSWTQETNPTNNILYSIEITQNQVGWIVGTNGTILKNSNLSSVLTNTVTKYFSLSQNYPNPFNPTTKIKYQLPELSKVKLTIYDVLGREVKILVNEEKPTGNYEVEFDGTNLPSGIYFYRIEAGNFSATKKFVLLK